MGFVYTYHTVRHTCLGPFVLDFVAFVCWLAWGREGRRFAAKQGGLGSLRELGYSV